MIIIYSFTKIKERTCVGTFDVHEFFGTVCLTFKSALRFLLFGRYVGATGVLALRIHPELDGDVAGSVVDHREEEVWVPIKVEVAHLEDVGEIFGGCEANALLVKGRLVYYHEAFHRAFESEVLKIKVWV